MRSARDRRRRLPAFAAAAALLLAGCSTGTPTAPATSAAPTTGAPTATTTASTGPQLDGALVVVSCTGTGPGSGFGLDLIDPNNGADISTRTFPLPQGAEAAAQCDSLFHPASGAKPDIEASAWAARSLFDREFRHLAVIVGHPDGSASVGYVDEKGALTEVIGSDPSHATTLTARREARFGRTDDTLWYLQGGDVYQVSSVVGSTPSKRGAVSPGSQVYPVTATVYAFGAGGRPDLLPSTNGQLWARLENPPKGQVEPTGLPHTLVVHKPPAADGTPGAAVATQRFDSQCFPDQWISNTQLLCLTKNGVIGERFAVVDVSGSTLKLRLVMPENTLTIGDPVVLGGSLFFLGARGGATSLYRVPLTGGDAVKLLDMQAGFAGHLIGTASR